MGPTCSSTSSAEMSTSSSEWVVDANQFPWVCSTPLGRPVVPDEYMIAATVEASRSTPGLGEPGSASKRRSSYAAPVRITSTPGGSATRRSEEHTSELQSLMRISYAVFCLKKKKQRH